MTQIDEYFDAEGIIHHKPSLDLVIKSISEGNQTSWEYGSGQAALYRRGDQTEISLVFTPSGDNSYFVQYFSSLMDQVHLMSTSRVNITGTSEIFVGGDPWQVPSKLFVEKSLVVDAIRDFYHNEKPSGHIEWIRDNEIEWPNQE
jgi:hypothetical protein